MEYRYWVIRYVPNVARGEFTNVGIVCGRDGGDWAVGFDTRSIKNSGSMSNDLRELRAWQRWFSGVIEAQSARFLVGSPDYVSVAWLERLRQRQANAIQFSDSSPIEIENAAAGVNLLFPHLVERPRRPHRQGLTRAQVRGEVTEGLINGFGFRKGVNLFTQPRVEVGKQKGTFDLARFESGENHLMQAWAFNVVGLPELERDIQSWNYLVGRLRNSGARLDLQGNQGMALSNSVPVEVVYEEPSSFENQRQDIFEAALEAWSMNEVNAVPLDHFLADTNAATRAVALESANHIQNW